MLIKSCTKFPLESKVEHEGISASFLNLEICIEDGQFVYKLYDKRDAFPFSIVRMPYLCSNIPKKIFYSALVGEFLRIARATLNLSDFIYRSFHNLLMEAKSLLILMKLSRTDEPLLILSKLSTRDILAIHYVTEPT